MNIFFVTNSKIKLHSFHYINNDKNVHFSDLDKSSH